MKNTPLPVLVLLGLVIESVGSGAVFPESGSASTLRLLVALSRFVNLSVAERLRLGYGPGIKTMK